MLLFRLLVQVNMEEALQWWSPMKSEPWLKTLKMQQNKLTKLFLSFPKQQKLLLMILNSMANMTDESKVAIK